MRGTSMLLFTSMKAASEDSFSWVQPEIEEAQTRRSLIFRGAEKSRSPRRQSFAISRHWRLPVNCTSKEGGFPRNYIAPSPPSQPRRAFPFERCASSDPSSSCIFKLALCGTLTHLQINRITAIHLRSHFCDCIVPAISEVYIYNLVDFLP